MEWTPPPADDDPLANRVDQIDFIVVRAVIAARQAASTTARAVAAASTEIPDAGTCGTASWFNGAQILNTNAASRGNFYSDHRLYDHRYDQLCANLGKSHA